MLMAIWSETQERIEGCAAIIPFDMKFSTMRAASRSHYFFKKGAGEKCSSTRTYWYHDHLNTRADHMALHLLRWCIKLALRKEPYAELRELTATHHCAHPFRLDIGVDRFSAVMESVFKIHDGWSQGNFCGWRWRRVRQIWTKNG